MVNRFYRIEKRRCTTCGQNLKRSVVADFRTVDNLGSTTGLPEKKGGLNGPPSYQALRRLIRFTPVTMRFTASVVETAFETRRLR